MKSVISEPWFYWAIGIAFVLPLTLVVLTEIQHSLSRRASVLARPVGLLRVYIVPLGALLLLLVKTSGVSVEETGFRIAYTVFAFAVLMMVLAGLNATIFEGAPAGSWRRRMPSIFVDVARFAIIAVGLAVILAYIWGANVAGLFTALGISSIVLGLTLQNSVGQIISGLLLLFEQPFQLGDWVETPSARGRVVEVNWRATHINTGAGLEIIPNSVLASQAFANLSRPAGGHTITVAAKFGGGDAPDKVCELLTRLAANLPQLHPGGEPLATALTSTDYATTIPVRSPADDAAARSTFQRWLWYASRRAGLHLDGVEDDFNTTQRRAKALRSIAPVLRTSTTEMETLLPVVRITRYGDQEIMQRAGEVPERVTFVIKGRVRLFATGADGTLVPVTTLYEGDFIGQTALTREPLMGSAQAVGEVTVLQVERDTFGQLLAAKPELIQDLGQAIDNRRSLVRGAVEQAGQAQSPAERSAP